MKRLVKAYQTYGGGSPEHLAALARYELKAYGKIINGKPWMHNKKRNRQGGGEAMKAFKYRITGTHKGQHMATAYCSNIVRALTISMGYARQGWHVTIN